LRVRSAALDVDLRALLQVFAAISASRLKNTTRCHSVRSCFSPLVLSFHWSVVAIEMLVIAPPSGRTGSPGRGRGCLRVITLLTDGHDHPANVMLSGYTLSGIDRDTHAGGYKEP